MFGLRLVTHARLRKELLAVERRLRGDIHNLREPIVGILSGINQIGNAMSQLDSSVDDLTSAVARVQAVTAEVRSLGQPAPGTDPNNPPVDVPVGPAGDTPADVEQ